MTKEECVKKACQVLRRRVRFKRASLRLPTTPFPGDDTPAIIEATKLYVETWIVPLLDSIESGDMTRKGDAHKAGRLHRGSSQCFRASLRTPGTARIRNALGAFGRNPKRAGCLLRCC
jgi:hypothetical protein